MNSIFMSLTSTKEFELRKVYYIIDISVSFPPQLFESVYTISAKKAYIWARNVQSWQIMALQFPNIF